MIHPIVTVPTTISLRDQLKGHQANLPDEIVGRLFRMRHVAVFHHDRENRKSGEPYHEHCLSVEDIVRQILAQCPAEFKSAFGEEEQEAACGHDLYEACIELGTLPEIKAELEGRFTPRVLRLIEALTKYDRETYWDQLFEANQSDPWVILIKIADRLHNLCTIKGFHTEKQREYLEETLGPLLATCRTACNWVRVNAPGFADIYQQLIEQLQGTAEQELERVQLELSHTFVFC